MRKLGAMGVAIAFVATSCIGGNGNSRTVLVDFQHEQFASAFLRFFPGRIAVHPGDSVVFRQTWTGEPHSVTMGTHADQYAQILAPYLKAFARGGYSALPPDEPKDLLAFEKKYLTAMEDDNGVVQQNGAQKCFLSHGVAPRKPSTPCSKAQQKQPEFTGRQSYYASGFIPYVRIGKRCIVGLGFWGCQLGKLPQANSHLLDGMTDPDRPGSSVPDVDTSRLFDHPE